MLFKLNADRRPGLLEKLPLSQLSNERGLANTKIAYNDNLEAWYVGVVLRPARSRKRRLPASCLCV